MARWGPLGHSGGLCVGNWLNSLILYGVAVLQGCKANKGWRGDASSSDTTGGHHPPTCQKDREEVYPLMSQLKASSILQLNTSVQPP